MNGLGATTYICVFCASSLGGDPAYRAAADETGRLLAARGFGLVYGGASVGLMGVLADAALAGVAPVVGVLPAVLADKEVAHRGLTELSLVGSMHERKAQMADRAAAFLALPGGFGTLDELCEIITWAQLGIHAKPIVLVNTQGFYDGFLAFLDHAVQQGFIAREHLARLLVADTPQAALAALKLALER